ncbi:MAG: hypothetical protein GY906_34905 [bacterium]|nr:hypothetical protein [bacterium]
MTRGATANLPAALTKLTPHAVRQLIKHTTASSILRITIAENDRVATTHTARIIACTGANRTVEFIDGSDLSPCEIPLDSDDPRAITNIKSEQLPLFITPQYPSRPVVRSNATIYVDGGANQAAHGAGAGAAGIKVYAMRNDECVVLKELAQFYPWTTNNITEYIAITAGFRFGERMLTEMGFEHVNIVCDSLNGHRGVLNEAPRDPKLRTLLEPARTIYRNFFERMTFMHMNRSQGNPSDRTVAIAMRQARSSNMTEAEKHLFEQHPHVPPQPLQNPPRPVISITNELESDKAEVPRNLAQFTAVHRYKCRNNVPDHSVGVWSRIVRHQLQRFIDAPPATKEDEAMRFFLLPTWYLPRNASSYRVFNHLQRGQPFTTALNSERRPRQHDREHRLTEAVTRLVADHKMRSANRLLSSAADAPDIPHDEKVQGMKEKLLDGDFTTSIERRNVPLIPGTEVVDALSKCSKQAANAVDGWSRRLLEQAISVDGEIASMVGNLLYWILTAKLTPFFQQVVDLSRGVGLPKPDAPGVRPICISSLFLKLLGIISTERDGTKPSETQYAIGVKDGARRIVHKIRKFIKNNPGGAVIRFDNSNAYGTLFRRVIEDIVKGLDQTMQQYFRLVYGAKTQIAVFGPDGTSFIPLGEGVKQGDATSSLLFCLGVDRAIGMIQQALVQRGIRAEVYMYMDDLTICVDAEHVNTVVASAINAFNTVGLKVNESKSKVLTDVPGNYALPQCHHTDEFIVLGANIATSAASFRPFIRRLAQRQQNYFALLDRSPLHPQIKATILRICGFPRILYHCSTTPPEYMRAVAKDFDDQVHRAYNLLIDPSGRTKVGLDVLHDMAGLGAPHYSMHTEELFYAFQRMSLEDDPSVPRVSLITNDLDTTTTRAQLDSQWMFYEATSTLTPAQFCNALSIRCNIVPSHLMLLNTKCNCGYHFGVNDQETIDHVLTCDQSTPLGHTYRHNLVRDAIIGATRQYGITTTKEPTCFIYNDGHRHRPDALFHTEPSGLAIDVSLVSTFPAASAIEEAEKRKSTCHDEAVAEINARFFAFVMATRGTLGPKAEKLINALTNAVQPFLKAGFKRHLRHVVANAAAKGRSDSLAAAARRATL